MKKLTFLVILGSFILSGCGYAPVYGVRANPDAVPTSSLSNIGLGAVRENGETRDSQTAQILRNNLLDRLGARGAATYTMTITVTRSVGNQTLQQDTSITRKQLRLSAKVNLIDNTTGQNVYANTLSVTASFNTPRNPYTTLIAEQDAEQRAANVLAENIITQMSIILSREAKQ